MEDDVRLAFDTMRAALDATHGRTEEQLDAVRGVLRDMTRQLNGKLDDLLSGMEAMRRDADVTRGHLAFVLEDSVTLGRRLTRLEEEVRRLRP